MQNADIEKLVLSGKLFNGSSRSSSPVRTPSPDAGWHDDELSSPNDLRSGTSTQNNQSIGMGTGRTGVKGVIRDRHEAREINRSKREKEVEEMNRRMEKASLGGKTFLEEEREKMGEDVNIDNTRRDVFGNKKEGRFGHLREVGVNGFVGAVEQEERDVWVIVHIFDSVSRFKDQKFRIKLRICHFCNSH
jgi:hypothetical protein